MRRLDDIIIDKIYLIITKHLIKKYVPDLEYPTINDIDKEVLAKFIEEFNIQGIILDVDETLRFNMKMIDEDVDKFIKELKSHLKIVVLSNGYDREIKEYFNGLGIEYIGFSHKPLKSSYKKAINYLDIDPNNILMIGNSIFDDIYGAKKNNIKTLFITKDYIDRGIK